MALNQRLQDDAREAISGVAQHINHQLNDGGSLGDSCQAAQTQTQKEHEEDDYLRRYQEHMGGAGNSIDANEARRFLTPRDQIAKRLEALLLTGLRESGYGTRINAREKCFTFVPFQSLCCA